MYSPNFIDWRGTPLESNLKSQFGVRTNDLSKLQQVMRNINIRNKTRVALDQLLNGEIYLQDCDKPYTRDAIQMFVEVGLVFNMCYLLCNGCG